MRESFEKLDRARLRLRYYGKFDLRTSDTRERWGIFLALDGEETKIKPHTQT